MKKCAFTLLFFIFGSINLCFSQTPSMSQIEKTQLDLEKERVLRTQVEKGKKVFIKKIIVKGVTLITEDRINETILPFKNHWFTEADINLILGFITFAYKQKGYQNQPAKISYQIKKMSLIIKVEELPH